MVNILRPRQKGPYQQLSILNWRPVIYQFQLMVSWGDPYYVGLNGLEFYDIEGNLIKLTENSEYYSVNSGLL